MISSSPPHGNAVYFDNAATSFPKPDPVVRVVSDFMTRAGGNPGRSGHRLSVESGEIVFDARERAARLFGVKNPMRVIMTSGATEALNLAILGLLRGGGHAVTTSMEHNSAARPLKELEKRGVISLTVVQCSSQGLADPDDIRESITPSTRLVVVNHGSNVFGTLQPVTEIGALCREAGVPLLVDAAQTAGVVPLDMARDNIDLAAFAGHKGLYGPTGTGGLVIADGFDHGRISPLKFGGTGSRSDSTEQPEFLPDVFESGTLNTAGIAGLAEGISYIESGGRSLASIRGHKKRLVTLFHGQASAAVRGFVVVMPPDLCETGVFSFNIDGMEPSDVAQRLSDGYDIMSRAGLHCARLAHRTAGTFPSGTVRFSFGMFNTADEVAYAVKALAEIAGGRK